MKQFFLFIVFFTSFAAFAKAQTEEQKLASDTTRFWNLFNAYGKDTAVYTKSNYAFKPHVLVKRELKNDILILEWGSFSGTVLAEMKCYKGKVHNLTGYNYWGAGYKTIKEQLMKKGFALLGEKQDIILQSPDGNCLVQLVTTTSSILPTFISISNRETSELFQKL